MVKEQELIITHTHIRVSKKTKDFIESKGKFGESRDEILRRLLKIK